MEVHRHPHCRCLDGRHDLPAAPDAALHRDQSGPARSPTGEGPGGGSDIDRRQSRYRDDRKPDGNHSIERVLAPRGREGAAGGRGIRCSRRARTRGRGLVDLAIAALDRRGVARRGAAGPGEDRLGHDPGRRIARDRGPQGGGVGVPRRAAWLCSRDFGDRDRSGAGGAARQRGRRCLSRRQARHALRSRQARLGLAQRPPRRVAQPASRIGRSRLAIPLRARPDPERQPDAQPAAARRSQRQADRRQGRSRAEEGAYRSSELDPGQGWQPAEHAGHHQWRCAAQPASSSQHDLAAGGRPPRPLRRGAPARRQHPGTTARRRAQHRRGDAASRRQHQKRTRIGADPGGVLGEVAARGDRTIEHRRRDGDPLARARTNRGGQQEPLRGLPAAGKDHPGAVDLRDA